MTTVTLSQAGLALIILEHRLEDELRSVRRWQRQIDDAQENLQAALEAIAATKFQIQKIKEGIHA